MVQPLQPRDRGLSSSQSSLPAALAAGNKSPVPAGDLRRVAGPVLALPVTAWLLLAFAAPFVTVVLLSLHEVSDPFGDLLQPPSLEQFRTLVQDRFYLRVVGETLGLAAGVTLLSALLGYPLALWLARLPVRWRPLAFAVILIPLLTNVVVRSLGIVLLLAPDGLINQVLGLVGLPPFKGMLYTHGAVAIALAQVFMPFMVLALYDVLQGTSPRVHEAAQSLGASRMTRVLLVDFPLSLPGLRAGIVIVFLMASTAYVSATLLGGKKVFTVGMLVWQGSAAEPERAARLRPRAGDDRNEHAVRGARVPPRALADAMESGQACRGHRPPPRRAAHPRRRRSDPRQAPLRRRAAPAAVASRAGLHPELQRRAPGHRRRLPRLHAEMVRGRTVRRGLLGAPSSSRCSSPWCRPP
jgi:ABC-type spermidine/putrescine transport system permease subunit I